MKKISIPLTVAALALAATSAMAETPFQTSVDQFRPLGSGNIDMVFTSDSSACTNSNTPRRYRIQPGSGGMTADGAKNIYAALLYAASFNKTVIVYFDETSSTCNITRVAVDETSG